MPDLVAQLLALQPPPQAGEYAVALALRQADLVLAAQPQIAVDELLRALKPEIDDTAYLTHLPLLIAARQAPLASALAYHSIGLALHLTSRDSRRTLPLMEIARACYLVHGAATLDLGRLLVTYASALNPVDPNESLAIAQQSVALLTAGSPYEQAVAYASQGNIYEQVGQADLAISSLTRAIEILDQLPADDQDARAERGCTLRDLGIVYQDYHDDYERARQCYEQAAELLAGTDEHQQLGSLAFSRGGLELDLGHFHAATRFFAEALHHYTQSDNQTDRALLRFYEARLDLAVGDTAGAVTKLHEARAAFDARTHKRELADSHIMLAQLVPAEGEALLLQAQDAFATMGNEHAEAVVLLEQARLIFRSQQDAAAHKLLDAAQVLFMRQRRPRWQLMVEVVRELHRPRLDPITLTACCERLAEFNDSVTQAQIQQVLGEQLEQDGDRVAAEEAYLRAIDCLDQAREQIQINMQLARFLTSRRLPYERALALAAGAGHLDRAWMYAERGRALALLDLLHNMRSDDALPDLTGDPRWAQVLATRAALNRALARGDAAVGRQATRAAHSEHTHSDEIRQLKQQLNDLLQAIIATGDHRAEWELGRVPSVDEIQAMLEPNTAIVQYVLVTPPVHQRGRQSQGRDLWALVLTRDSLHVYGPERPLATQRDLRLLRGKLGAEPLATTDPAQLPQVLELAGELHRLFIAPLESQIAGASSLILVPPDDDEWLRRLPLHAAHDGTRYLVQKTVVSYAPSASVLWLSRQQAARPVRRVLAAHYATNLGTTVRDEVEHVRRYFPAADMHGGPFAVDALLANMRAADLIHLSCHGDADERPEDAPFTHIVIDREERVYAHDILRMRLHAELIVLSACNVGRNDQGHIGMVGSLLGAGARSVVATLWPAHSKASVELMRHFYAALRAVPAQGRAAALCAAQCRLIEGQRYSLPFYWAPFFLSGVTDPLNL